MQTKNESLEIAQVVLVGNDLHLITDFFAIQFYLEIDMQDGFGFQVFDNLIPVRLFNKIELV